MEELINRLRQSIEDIDTLIWVLEGHAHTFTVDKAIDQWENIPTDLTDTFKEIKEKFGSTLTVLEDNKVI